MHPLYFLSGSLFVFSAAASSLVKRANPQGVDVSHFQGTIDWNAMAANGVSFAYIKATEGTSMITLFSPLYSFIIKRLSCYSVYRSYVLHELYWRDECRYHPGGLPFRSSRYLGRRHPGQLLPLAWRSVHITVRR